MRQWRWLGQVAGNALDRSSFDLPKKRDQAVNVRCFGKAIVNALFDQRMIRNFPVAYDVLEAGELIGKNRGQKVLRFHPLQRRRNSSAATLQRQSQRPRGIPPPSDREHWRVQERLHQDFTNRIAMEVTKNLI